MIMKKFERSILRKVNHCIGLILSVLGVTLSGCDQGKFSTAYGTPSAEFRVSGRVQNAYRRGIGGIKVTLKKASEYGNIPFASDTTSTNGAFYVDRLNILEDDTEYWIVAEDVDSTENGLYQADSVLVAPKYQQDPNNSWHSIASIDDVTIVLKEKE